MKEVYKKIKGYDYYEVSNLGNIKSLIRVSWIDRNKCYRVHKEKLIELVPDGAGYLRVGLSKYGKHKSRKTRRIHQLVAEAFLNHKPCGYKLVVNHKDFNKLNNRMDNLEIVTQRENTNKKHIKSSSQYTGVSWHKAINKWASYIFIKGKLKHLGYFNNELEASNMYKQELKNITNGN